MCPDEHARPSSIVLYHGLKSKIIDEQIANRPHVLKLANKKSPGAVSEMLAFLQESLNKNADMKKRKPAKLPLSRGKASTALVVKKRVA